MFIRQLNINSQSCVADLPFKYQQGGKEHIVYPINEEKKAPEEALCKGTGYFVFSHMFEGYTGADCSLIHAINGLLSGGILRLRVKLAIRQRQGLSNKETRSESILSWPKFSLVRRRRTILI